MEQDVETTVASGKSLVFEDPEEFAIVQEIEEQEKKSDLPAATIGALPDWADIPPGLKCPRGREVIVVKLQANWTHTPWKGDRTLVVWALSDGDEKVALKRAMGDSNRAPYELAKQMIRAFDGRIVSWDPKSPDAHIENFWNEIGSKNRQIIVRLYLRLNVLSEDERRDFFENCVAVRTTG